MERSSPISLLLFPFVLAGLFGGCSFRQDPTVEVNGLLTAPTGTTRYAVGTAFEFDVSSNRLDRDDLVLESSAPAVVELGAVDAAGDVDATILTAGEATVTLRGRDGTVYRTIRIVAVVPDRVMLYPESYAIGRRFDEDVPRVAAAQAHDVGFFVRAFNGDESLLTGGVLLEGPVGTRTRGEVTLRAVPEGTHTFTVDIGATQLMTTLTAVPVGDIVDLVLRDTTDAAPGETPSTRTLYATPVDASGRHVIGVRLDYTIDGAPGELDLLHGWFVWDVGGTPQRLDVTGAGYTATADIDPRPGTFAACSAGGAPRGGIPAAPMFALLGLFVVRRRRHMVWQRRR